MPGDATYSESFSKLLAYLQGLYHTYQFMHWQVSGDNYYGDHLLFQRLYESVDKEIDPVAEKAIGLTNDPSTISPIQHSNLVSKYLAKFADGAEDGIHASLRAERGLLDLILQIKAALEHQGKLTDGLDNMLQGVADTHEGHVYLLQQRLSNPQGVQAMLTKAAGPKMKKIKVPGGYLEHDAENDVYHAYTDGKNYLGVFKKKHEAAVAIRDASGVRAMLTKAAGPAGKAQKAIMQALPAGAPVDFNDFVASQKKVFHGVHYAAIQRAAEALNQKGLVRYNGKTIVKASQVRAANDPPRIMKLRKIVKDKQHAKVEGLMVDLYTASVLVQVYDALSGVNKMKFAQMPLRQMVDVGYKLVKSDVEVQAATGGKMFDAKAKQETIATLLKAGRPDLVKEVMALKANLPAEVNDALNNLQQAKKLRYPDATVQNLYKAFIDVANRNRIKNPQRLLASVVAEDWL